MSGSEVPLHSCCICPKASTYNYDRRQSLILEQIIVFGEDYIVVLV